MSYFGRELVWGLVLASCCTIAHAELPADCHTHTSAAPAPHICKIDPPNWWPAMPAPMLLAYGEGLDTAQFTLSDTNLHLQKVGHSANGHYAQLWLAEDPSKPQTIQIRVKNKSGSTEISYTFAPRRAASDGFAGFSSADVMYLIMPDRFADGDPANDGPDHADELAKPRGWHGGDLRGITQHLDYLQQLGITTVWITPVEENHEPQSYHGYGATDLYRIDEHFGNLDDLKALATALHARHMKLVLDRVPNHIGPAHPWVNDSPDPTWFHGTLAQHDKAQGEFAPITDPHAPWRDQKDITQGWFANVLPDLNQEDPAVERYLIQNTMWWVEQAGVDGLRLDTFPYVGRAFWHDFHAELHATYPHLTSVGEVFNGDPTITSTFAAGVTRTGVDTGLDTPFDFPSYFALREVFLKDAPMSKLAEVLRLDNLFPHPERLVPFLGNHDTSRFMNDPAATLAKLQLAFTVLTTMRGMPQIYSGDELAMRGGDDPDDRRDFPGGFTPASHDAFQSQGRTPEEAQAYNSLQKLLQLRSTTPALQHGTEQLLSVDKDVMVYARVLESSAGTQRVLIAVNKSKSGQDLSVITSETTLAGLTHAQLLLGDGTLTLQPNLLKLHLGSESAVIFNLN
ncbi:alpha-amylase family glycosyl hydrolase [Granulicella paludicola]|uniref:alpha-amylase family glycosyl hydrolase n=1 Tax=Granulicella paludicola TaxID=474951 RepID=UPI0021E0B575|nr:alpha-amylase family glycosyl hydrolase [Granulicella paludicola]